MDLAMALIVAILFAGGTYLILKPNLIRIVMGLSLYSNAANLAMITTSGYSPDKGAPFVHDGPGDPNIALHMMDPLPPDIILTAIVISFAIGALFLVTCYRVYRDYRTDDPGRLPKPDGEEGMLSIGDDRPPVMFDPMIGEYCPLPDPRTQLCILPEDYREKAASQSPSPAGEGPATGDTVDPGAVQADRSSGSSSSSAGPGSKPRSPEGRS